MPATSKAQRRLMGMAYAYKTGKLKNASAAVKKLADQMSEKDLKDFASTPETDLPEKVEEQFDDELDEVTPPGYEKVVKGLKKNPKVDNPWAIAWSMKNKGIKPKNESMSLMQMYEQIYKSEIKDKNVTVFRDKFLQIGEGGIYILWAYRINPDGVVATITVTTDKDAARAKEGKGTGSVLLYKNVGSEQEAKKLLANYKIKT